MSVADQLSPSLQSPSMQHTRARSTRASPVGRRSDSQLWHHHKYFSAVTMVLGKNALLDVWMEPAFFFFNVTMMAPHTHKPP